MLLNPFKIKWKVTFLLALPLIGKTANLATLDSEFIRKERLLSICQIASKYKDFSNLHFSTKEIKKYIAPSENCLQIADEYSQLVSEIQNQNSSRRHFYPYYSELVLKNSSHTFLLQNPEEKNTLTSSTLNPWALEYQLRQINKSKPGACILENLTSYQQALENENSIYNNSFFRQFFIENGYTCTVQLYQRLSVMKGLTSESEQALYENTLVSLKNKNLKEKKYASELIKEFKESVMVYVPQLGYELPPEDIGQALKSLLGLPPDPSFRNEQLAYQELKSFFRSQGIPFYVLKRISLDPMEKQVLDSANHLKTILFKEQLPFKKHPKKIIFLARSMGGLVTRLLLKTYPELQKFTKGVLMIGTTPYGSVIAEHKSRGDIHFLTVARKILDKQPNKLISQFVPTLKASLLRPSLESMSSEKYQPQRDNDEGLDYPVVNVIFLRKEANTYFETLGPKVPEVDLTFFNMLAYGPSEGSSPLTHASWDTPNSVRIFDFRLNHLGFWGQSSNEGLKIYEAALSVLANRLHPKP